MGEAMVLCVANAYQEKYYFNEDFSRLPMAIREELQIMCVLFTADVGGILTLLFDEEGSLRLVTSSDEGDLLYDEIGSVLKVKQLQEEKKELLEGLELYYKAFILGESITGNL